MVLFQCMNGCRNSVYFSIGRSWKRLIHEHFRYKQSNIQSIYVPEIFEDDDADDLQRFSHTQHEIFGLQARFIPPVEFNYALPNSGIAEYAFIGRSNVGKSSLITNLLGNSKIVRVSKEPGCTRSVNYYAFERQHNSSSHAIYLVDLPGYGYAKASKKDQWQWKSIIDGYFRARSQGVLRRVFVLVDGRHGLKSSDVEMMCALDACILPYQILITKADVATPQEIIHSLDTIFTEALRRKIQRSCLPVVHVLSSRTGYGIDYLKLSITEINSYKWMHIPSNNNDGGNEYNLIDNIDQQVKALKVTPESLHNEYGSQMAAAKEAAAAAIHKTESLTADHSK